MGTAIVGFREKLPSVKKPNATTHAGLWLDKYLQAHGDDKSKKELVQQVAKIRTPQEYTAFFARWKAALDQAGAKTRHAKTQGRLAINLGAESVLETSIALHRTYGVPYIPGSALKGLAASFAHQYLEGDEWRKDTGDAYKELFGTTEQAGCVTFFDALYVPESGKHRQALWPDIITVHHPAYYQGRGEDNPPADWDSPTPIPFLTATGRFLIALAGPEAWVKTAFEILGMALMQEGIGAKTNSGYGRMKLESMKGSQPASPVKTQPTTPNKTPEKPLTWKKGTVRYFDPRSGRGKLIDSETQQEFAFNRSALPKGWSPGKRQRIKYALSEDGQSVLKIQKSY